MRHFYTVSTDGPERAHPELGHMLNDWRERVVRHRANGWSLARVIRGPIVGASDSAIGRTLTAELTMTYGLNGFVRVVTVKALAFTWGA